MAVEANWYTFGLVAVASGEVNLQNDTIKVALLKNTYTPSQEDQGWSEISSHEVAGTGYSSGGATLQNKSLTPNTTDIAVTFDADDVTWTNSEITARYAVVYDDTATGKPLLALVDFGEDMTSSNGPFTLQWHANGILRFTNAA